MEKKQDANNKNVQKTFVLYKFDEVAGFVVGM